MRFLLLAILMVLNAALACAADPFSAYVSEESLRALRAGQQVRASLGEAPVLSPAVSSRERLATDVQQVHPTVGVEILRIIGGSRLALDTPGGWLAICNAVHAVSSMQGITYWSVSRNSMQVLFSQSYVITSPTNPARIADPVFTRVPADDVLLTVQEDRSFGRNQYQESFAYRTDHLVVKIENISTISFLFVPLIPPRSLVSEVILIPAGPDLLFYGIAYSRTLVPIGDRRSREDSLSNRLIAVADWLKARLSLAG